MLLKKIWLTPPFAIARVGRSQTPCASFFWGENDLSPRGTGKTTILPAETLTVSETGEITGEIPTHIYFKDKEGFRPVCPFFELKCEWEDLEGNLYSGSVTPDLLEKLGVDASSIFWTVEIANLKAYHYTQAEQEKIFARLELRGNDTEKKELLGAGHNITGKESLFLDGANIPMGFIQLSKPNKDYPEYRLRFYAPKGNVYGPQDLASRDPMYHFPSDRLIVNSNSEWAQYRPSLNDSRTNPSGLYASYNDNGLKSLGLIDDVGDGIIRCSLNGFTASCRITVGPPDYAPDRRPFVSLADGLKDRITRSDVLTEEYISESETTSEEIRDLFERVLETMELMNLDYQNARAINENIGVAQGIGLPESEGANKLFPSIDKLTGRPLPLTELGRQTHRRFIALEVIEDKLRENPELLDRWIRKPMTGDRFYDMRMPPLMRGSDRYPMHVTQRQYNLLKAWVKSLRNKATPGT